MDYKIGEPVWLKTAWKEEELDGKTVRCRMRIQTPSHPNTHVDEIGKFRVLTNPMGLTRIDIAYDVRDEFGAIAQQTCFVDQSGEKLIKRNVNQAESEFTLFQF